jgi:hypothetical protein
MGGAGHFFYQHRREGLVKTQGTSGRSTEALSTEALSTEVLPGRQPTKVRYVPQGQLGSPAARSSSTFGRVGAAMDGDHIAAGVQHAFGLSGEGLESSAFLLEVTMAIVDAAHTTDDVA